MLFGRLLSFPLRAFELCNYLKNAISYSRFPGHNTCLRCFIQTWPAKEWEDSGCKTTAIIGCAVGTAQYCFQVVTRHSFKGAVD
ncbi:hypothetical protein B0H12DRAFT_165428 [Mycena haematopus]|nr:hypothetical protein B0H12DRAFT_168017 [Mycena haematopus]KAJ7234053.1 hypothetical protein B0H12DRAFT_165428 [Mycena haematopus]